MLEAIPPSIFVSHLVPFIESSKDLLALRVTSKSLKSMLHESDVSEQIWKYFLCKEFHFDNDANESSNGSTTSINSSVHHLKCLKVSLEKPPHYDPTDPTTYNDNDQSTGGGRRRATSIFGYSASNGVYTAGSTYESWRQWSIAKQRYCDGCPCDKIQYVTMNAPYFLRAACLWSKIENWCNQEKNIEVGNRIMNSLLNGNSFTNGRFVEYYPNQPIQSNDPYFNEIPAIGELHGKGTDAFRAIFAFYDGQFTNKFPEANESDYFCSGLFGGYVAYQFISCMRMTSSSFCGRRSTRFKCIAMNSFNGVAFTRPSFVYLDCRDGNMFTSDFGPDEERSLLRAQPVSIVGRNDTCDFGLIWMEELARKLDNNELEVGSIGPDGEYCKMIVVYPTEKCQEVCNNNIPRVARTVTKGIEIVASSHFDPFIVDYVSYSIRMRLLTSGEEGYMSPSERGFETCQLVTRHWLLTNGSSGQDEIVNGEGVIGLYPLLMEGGYRNDQGRDASTVQKGSVVTSEKMFRYQSLSSTDFVSFRGQIRFMPGSIKEPTGDPFYVDVGRFALVGPHVHA